jgi:hypothetical protein
MGQAEDARRNAEQAARIIWRALTLALLAESSE